MRWIFRLTGAVLGMAVVALVVNRAAVRAGGGIPTKGDKKSRARSSSGTSAARRAVPAERPGPGPARREAALAAEVRRLRVAEVVPKNALLFATIPDLSELRSASRQLSLARILDEPAVSAKISGVLEALRGSARDAPGEGLMGFIRMALSANVDYSEVKPLFRKELALVGLRPSKEGGDVRFAVVAVVGPNRQPFTEVSEDLIGEIIDRYPQTTHAPPEERGETKIRGLRVGSYQISFACYENLLIVATGKGTVGELIDTCAAGEAKQLAGDPEFKKARDDMDKGALLFYRMDLGKGIAKSLRSLVLEETGRAARAATGAPGTGTLWGGVYPDGTAIRERREIRTQAKTTRSMLAAGGLLPMPPRSLKYFSVDTVAYAAFSCNPVKLLEEINKNKAALDAVPRLKSLAGAAAEFGLADSLSAIGGELAVGVAIPHGRNAEVTAVLQVKRRDLLEKFEDAIVKGLARRKFKKEEFRRHTIHYVDAPKESGEAAVGGMSTRGLAYTRAMQEGQEFLLIASSRRTLRKAIRQSEFRKSCLSEKEDFKRCLGAVRPRWTSALYADAPRIVDLLRGSISTGAGEAQEGSLSGAKVAAALAPHLFGLGVVSDQHADGSFRESYGPVGPVPGSMTGLVATIVDLLRGSVSTGPGAARGESFSGADVATALAPHLFGLGVISDQSGKVSFQESYGPVGPVTGAAIELLAALQAKATSKAPTTPAGDAANLARIGVGVQLYATDFDRFPSRLSELHDEYVGSLVYFNSPGGKGQVKTKDDVDAKSDYVYVRGLRPTDLSSMIVAYTKEHVQGGGGRSVLFLDGRVEVLYEAAFQSALKAQVEAMGRR